MDAVQLNEPLKLKHVSEIIQKRYYLDHALPYQFASAVYLVSVSLPKEAFLAH